MKGILRKEQGRKLASPNIKASYGVVAIKREGTGAGVRKK